MIIYPVCCAYCGSHIGWRNDSDSHGAVFCISCKREAEEE